jgi:predicted nucleotidyltransferase component of viral defense system
MRFWARKTPLIDITFNESLEFSPVRHRHTFEDLPTVSLHAYSIEEILVEKLRSLYQRARARDYYDIYHLLNRKRLTMLRFYMRSKRKAQHTTSRSI